MSSENSNSNQQDQLITLGWREWISLPELGITKIKTKVDTGARTSALHAFFVEPYKEQGAQHVRFGIHPIQGDSETSIICTAPVMDKREVTDSGGHKETRYIIEATAEIGTTKRKIEMSLTNRDTMKFRMLLGRTALAGEFKVDPELSYCCGTL
jgi:hypothetical protein